MEKNTSASLLTLNLTNESSNLIIKAPFPNKPTYQILSKLNNPARNTSLSKLRSGAPFPSLYFTNKLPNLAKDTNYQNKHAYHL